METIFLLGLVILITHTLEGITGFGCTVIAMPFAVALCGLEQGRTVLTITALLQCLWISMWDFKYIDKKECLKILVLMSAGMPFGMFAYRFLNEHILLILLALFSCAVSIRGLCLFFLKHGRERQKKHKGPFAVLLFVGGVIHGAFTSGGPLAISYATEEFQDKRVFRATMCALWSVLNTLLLVQLIFGSSQAVESVVIAGLTIPFLVVGIILGNLAHHGIKDRYFTPLSYSVLLISSAFLFFRA